MRAAPVPSETIAAMHMNRVDIFEFGACFECEDSGVCQDLAQARQEWKRPTPTGSWYQALSTPPFCTCARHARAIEFCHQPSPAAASPHGALSKYSKRRLSAQRSSRAAPAPRLQRISSFLQPTSLYRLSRRDLRLKLFRAF